MKLTQSNFKEHSFGNILNNGSLSSHSQVTTQKDNSRIEKYRLVLISLPASKELHPSW